METEGGEWFPIGRLNRLRLTRGLDGPFKFSFNLAFADGSAFVDTLFALAQADFGFDFPAYEVEP